ncbi:T9SS sorting signal type C domain-containing protein [Flavobacterium gelatinilyticum]|uniref:T9SS sorting signal type C domain-containing protein n=1 Tax=Flavobacterium gelatinilyticum TaxID=3003260 RepID=UPI00247FDC89|nr:T9SS sorting signal type C domain-containing protein [Flavobacterium gelatinilyticum]
MKKTLLLVLVLLPFLGISQNVDFVQWNGSTDLVPTVLNNYVEASNVTGAGFSNGNPTPTYDGIEGTNWSSSSTIDVNRYFQITLNPILNGRILLNEIQFTYKGNASSYEVRYSKQANFSSPVTLTTVTNAATNNTPTSGNLSGLNIAVNAGEKIYIRFYAYNGTTWKLMNNNLLKLRGSFVQNPSPMNGTYIIGSAAGASFATLTSAVRALNSVGVSGAVNLMLDNTTYNVSTGETFPLVINPYTGNTSYKVTFKPNTGRTVTIESSNSNNSTEAVFKLNGVDNVVFDGSNTTNGTTKNLTIYNNNQSNNNRSVIWIASQNNSNGANSNEIKNLILRQYARGTYDYSVGIFAGGTSSVTSTAETANSSNIINNVTFTGAGLPIYLEGNSNSLSTGWKIQNNTIGGTTNTNKPHVGIRLNNAKDYEVSQNTISGILRSNSNGPTDHNAGISIYGTSNGAIFGNKISDVYETVGNTAYCAGIYVDSGNNSIYNNFINNIRTSAADDNNYNFQYKGHGIYINSGSSNKIYHNTIVMDNTSAGGRSSCLYIANGSNIGIKNNIFYSSQTIGTQYLIFSNTAHTAITEFDNNDYFLKSSGTLSNRLSSGTYTTLAQWKAVSSAKEQNSINVEPKFISTIDFHLEQNTNSSALHAKGAPIASITTDIDNEVRSTTAPDMGADEIIVCEQGDQTAFGINSWIGYVYKWTGTVPNPAVTAGPATATNVFIGNVTEPRIFDRNIGTGTVRGVTTNICGSAPADNFFVRYKMQTTTTAGTYNFTIGGDDGVRLYIDGVLINVAPANSYAIHSYTTYAAQVTLTAGTHSFILEYFENAQDSRVSFSYGEIKGDVALPYGENKWNVYGFSTADINLPAYSYAGMYVDNSLNVNTQTSWNKNSSPSTYSGWQGAPIGVDQFTITYKRHGFTCGSYQIQLVNCDDVGEIYIDEVKVYTQNGYTNTSTPIRTAPYALNKDSKVEIRLREDGGDANIAVSFVPVPNVYDGTTAPASGSPITITSNTTISTDLNVCSCTINAGVILTVPKGRTLNVEETTIVGTGGKLLIEDGGSFLQKSTASDAYQGAMNSFELKRKTTPISRYDFTFWSSPVTLASNFTLHDLSPDTLADKYYIYNPSSGWVIDYGGTSTKMVPGEGYNVRAPQTFDINLNAIYETTFKGLPNNGNVTVNPVGGKWNIVGNPYPSAIDGVKFIQNTDVGAVYFWTHANKPVYNSGSNTYKYATTDYTTFNLTGTAGPDFPGSVTSTGNIGAGQGFFVKSPSGNPIVFTNDMRVAGNNSNFYKTAQTAELERNRLWLNFTNTEGAFKQALVGYVEGASDSWDVNYDAVTLNGNNFIDFYSINEAKKLTIQGRALPFEESDIVPLGYRTTITGEFTIAIDHVDGIFTNQNVYLEDKVTGKIQDLKVGNYTFSTAIGTFSDRFTIRYTNKTLGNDDFETIEGGLLVSVKNKVIGVTSAKENIKEVNIYDISGRLLYSKNKVDSAELSISNLQSSNQVLLVKVTLENDAQVTKKIIFN